MATTDTPVQQLVINKLTKEQYENITTPNPTELYFVPETPASTTNLGPVKVDGVTITAASDGTISSTAVVTIDSAINASSTNPVQNKIIYAALQTKANDTDVVHTTGNETIAGNKTFTGTVVVPIIQTGSAANNYFQSQKFRGEGDANTYYHAVDFGYSGHDRVDFYDYGGVFQFHKHQGAGINDQDTVLGTINDNGWEGNVLGNVTGTASRATADASGNVISTTYQVALVSGTNIKTVNGNSLLGSGNLTIDALPLTGGTMSPSAGETEVKIAFADSNDDEFAHFSASQTGTKDIELVNEDGEVIIDSWQDTARVRGDEIRIEADTDIEISSNDSQIRFDSDGISIDTTIGNQDDEKLKINGESFPIKSSLYAMPSSTYTDLTLGSSGTTYTAPANGWFVVRADGSAANTSGILTNTSNGVGDSFTTGNGGSPWLFLTCPALKGQNVLFDYSSLTTIYWFRFVYAEGSKSEAS